MSEWQPGFKSSNYGHVFAGSLLVFVIYSKQNKASPYQGSLLIVALEN